jgi:biotin-(acetyl-CoA carboxylase) ligase
LRAQITSLADIASAPIDMTDALIAVARHLHTALSRRGERLFAETLRRYDEHHALMGRKVSVVEAGSGQLVGGRCSGLDSSGRLILRDHRKVHRVIAGQVRVH